MSTAKNQPTRTDFNLTEYVKLLGLSTFVLMLFTVSAGVVASLKYEWNAGGIEGIWHRDLSQGWTITLLWIPLTIQLLVLMFLTARVWKHKGDQTIRHYFKFYFVRTFISTFAYVFLWMSYTLVMEYPIDSGKVRILRWVSLGFILLLMYFVVQATYLITRSSFRHSNRLFTATDIDEKYSCICEKLGALSPASKKGAPINSEEAVSLELKTDAPISNEEVGLQKIHEWLLKDRDYKIHRVAYKGTMADLDIPHMTEALNRLVCSRQFYNDRNGNKDGNDLPISLFEQGNRKFINDNLLMLCDSDIKDTHRQLSDKKDRSWWKIGPFWGGDGRSDKQMGQREGIALFPFYTMVFFFSLFLCVAYLFGLAFAFEDRSVQLDAQSPLPGIQKTSLGLLMSDDLLEDVGRYSTPVPSPTPLFYQLNDRQKFFYFQSGGAGITTDTGGTTDKRLQRIAQINRSSLKAVIDLIRNALPNGGLRVLMVGRADDSSVDKVTYASNHEIATARINSVRYLLQEKLIEERVSPKDLAKIDWVGSPFSNDGSLVPKEKQYPEGSKLALVLDNENGPTGQVGAKVPKEFITKLDEDLTFKYGDKAWCDEFRSHLGRLKDEVKKNTVTLEVMRQIHDDITRWAGHRDRGEPQAETLEDDIDAELYQIEDPSGRKRSVEVYLYDTKPPMQETVNKQQLQPNAKRMSLLDYLYFAITNGSNDVKPITPFSKFLCTFANLNQFFFIVVFFNTLLSLKKKRDRG